MNLTRTIAIGMVGGAVITWLSWAAAPPPRPPLAAERGSRAIDRSSAELAREIERLREHLTPDASPGRARNVFAFSPAAGASVARPPAPSPKTENLPVADPLLRAPALTLEGMAEEETADGVSRTAIISAEGQLFLAKVGDPVTSRYRVERVRADGVELTDQETGATLRLVLR